MFYLPIVKILRYDDDQAIWEPLENVAHLVAFKEYIAQQKSVGSSRKKNAIPKKIVNYARKSSEALSSTHAAATKADDETGKGIQTSICLFTY